MLIDELRDKVILLYKVGPVSAMLRDRKHKIFSTFFKQLFPDVLRPHMFLCPELL